MQTNGPPKFKSEHVWCYGLELLVRQLPECRACQWRIQTVSGFHRNPFCLLINNSLRAISRSLVVGLYKINDTGSYEPIHVDGRDPPLPPLFHTTIPIGQYSAQLTWSQHHGLPSNAASSYIDLQRVFTWANTMYGTTHLLVTHFISYRFHANAYTNKYKT